MCLSLVGIADELGRRGTPISILRLNADTYIDEYDLTIHEGYRKQVLVVRESYILNVHDLLGV